MPKLQMYSVYDAKSESFMPPYFSKTHGEAERNFTVGVQKGDSQISQFPEDFSLFYIGTYDDTSGLCEPLKAVQQITTALSVKNRSN